MRAAFILLLVVLVAGCRRPSYDTSTPEATLDSAVEMVRRGDARSLPSIIEIPARDIAFDDGVTEASAIAEVKDKMGEMLQQVLRVAETLRRRFPAEVDRELKSVLDNKKPGVRDTAIAILSDPSAWLEAQRPRLAATDLGDGTAALTFDGEPILAGVLTLAETDDGWRFRVPVELARESPYWPDTRHEWSVLASMMLAVEHALEDFQRDLDRGKITSLSMASSRVGRLVGESVAVQSIIYAAMKRPENTAANTASTPAQPPSAPAAAKPAG
jgi:hypothetical protein